MIKRFNNILRKRIIIQKFWKGQVKIVNYEEFLKLKHEVIQPQQLLQLAMYDSNNNFKYYNSIKTNFERALKEQKYLINHAVNHDSSEHIRIFSQTLSILCKYPMLQLDSQSLRAFYKLVSQNIHSKSNELLQNCLAFSILTDKQALYSPLYLEFAKFYVSDFSELLRAKFSIKLNQQNIINTVKLFIFKIFQRGFLPRISGYSRNLYINSYAIILQLLLKNQDFHSTLFIKKITFQYFSLIKQFYQKQMKQNLYHKRNIELMQNYLIKIVPYLAYTWGYKIDSIQSECKYLRQLYIKLFLVISQHNQKEVQLKRVKQNKIKIIKNCIFMYKAIKQKYFNYVSKDCLLQDNEEIQLLNQYLNQVQIQFFNFHSSIFSKQIQQQDYKNFKQLQKNIIDNFQFQQIVLILIHSIQLKIHDDAQLIFLQNFSNKFSNINFKAHFKLILKLLNINSYRKNILNSFRQEEVYNELQLSSLTQLSCQDVFKQDLKMKEALLKSILQKDIKEINNEVLLNLLKIYKNINGVQVQVHTFIQLESNLQALIVFVLRFLADHHLYLPFDTKFQQILKLLFLNQNSQNLSSQFQKNQLSLIQKNFNDEQNNYPLSIDKQMTNHLKKNLWKLKNSQLKQIIEEKLEF